MLSEALRTVNAYVQLMDKSFSPLTGIMLSEAIPIFIVQRLPCIIEFQSPYGANALRITDAYTGGYINQQVSVPLRG